MFTEITHDRARLAWCWVLTAMVAAPASGQTTSKETTVESTSPPAAAVATFGGGCFWCTEALFQQVRGVKSVVSGFMGGDVDNPTYRQVCTGTTGHAEVIQITYDPRVVAFEKLLEIHWKTHDPTTLNRQGADIGTQYRSAIFYHTDEQRKAAERLKSKLDQSGAYSAPIVTEIVAAKEFYAADDYHQNYFARNGDNRYCEAVIQPKVDKFRKVFADVLDKSKP